MTIYAWGEWQAVDTNPNNPLNWQPNGVPGKTDTLVFPYGNVQLLHDMPFYSGIIIVEGGANVFMATLPICEQYGFYITGGGHLYVTAPPATGPLDTIILKIDNGSSIISAVQVYAEKLSLTGGSRAVFQSGLTVETLTIDNGSEIDVYGSLTIGGVTITSQDQLSALVNVPSGSSFKFYPSPASCYEEGTLIRMGDGHTKAIEDIKAGDILFGGHAVVWLGRGGVGQVNDYVAFSNYGDRVLHVTPNHLMEYMGFLYPAHSLVRTVPNTYHIRSEKPYYHIQCHRHVRVYANDIASESFLNVNGQGDMETVSGTFIEDRKDHSDSFQKIVRVPDVCWSV